MKKIHNSICNNCDEKDGYFFAMENEYVDLFSNRSDGKKIQVFSYC